MPTLVNYSGDDEFGTSGLGCSMDSGLLFSIDTRVADFCCPPRKRARINSPYVLMVEEEKKKPSIEILPEECLFEIFRRLPGGQERNAAACVSKRWLMLLSNVKNSEIIKKNTEEKEDTEMILSEDEVDGFLTRNVVGKKASDVRLAAIAVGTSTRGGLGKLLVRDSNGVSDIGISAIAHGCPSLKSLSLWDVPCVGDEGLIEIAKECHLLEKLDLSHCPLISNHGVIAIAEKCPNLTSLTIESCSRIGNESLQAIGRFCAKLKSVSIVDCPLVGDQGVATLLSSTSSVLRKVKLEGLNITDFSLAVIGHYGKSITNLVLTGLQGASQRGFWAMGSAQGLQSLTSLMITSCLGMTDLSLEAIGNGCGSLKHVSLNKCCIVSDNGLVAFCKVASFLESLRLEECNRITQQGILGALSNCKSNLKSLSLVKCMGIRDFAQETPILAPCESLQSLTIKNCLGFGNTSLESIGRLCPQLEQVDLSGLSAITDAGLVPLVKSSLAGLVEVNLSNCVNLTDNVVSDLTRLHGETLEKVNLEGCKKITDESLVALAKNCLFLKDLHVSKCSVTDSGVASLSHGKLNLQVLSLSGCPRVTNKSVPSFKKLGRTLIGLDLQHCNSITCSTIDHLIENLWRCDILY